MNEEIRGILESKAQKFDRIREQSVSETQERISKFINKLKEMENELLTKIEAVFCENIFSCTLAEIACGNSESVKRAEEVSKQPIPEPIYPSDEDMRATLDAVQRLMDSVKPIPRGAAVKAESANSLTLSWKKTPNATEYRVEMKRPNESDFHEIYRGANTTTTVGGLKEEGKHQLRICAAYGSEVSGWSEAVQGKPWILRAPQNIVTSSEEFKSIKATWNEVRGPVNAPVSYQIEVKLTENQSWVKTFNSDKTFITEKGFEGGKDYSVRVRSVCCGTTSEWSGSVNAKQCCLTAPQNVKVKVDSNKNLEVTWDRIAGPANAYITYIVEFKATDGRCTRSFNTDKTSFTGQGLEPGKKYEVRVQSVCNGDASEWSKEELSTLKREGLVCLEGHTLKPFDFENVYMRYAVNSIECQDCGRTFTRGSEGTFYGCRTCKYIICPECGEKIVKQMVGTCPQGHPFTHTTFSQLTYRNMCGSIRCNRCRKTFEAPFCSDNKGFLNCPTCGFCLCSDCSKKQMEGNIEDEIGYY